MATCTQTVWQAVAVIGDTFERTFKYSDANGAPLPWPGYTGSLQLRSYAESEEIAADWSAYITVSDDESEFYLVVLPGVTGQLEARSYAIDFQLTSADESDIRTHAAGTLIATRDVTR